MSFGEKFGGQLTIIDEYQFTGWTGIYDFVPDKAVMGGTCTVTLQSPVQYFHVTTDNLLMYVRADYPIPSNQFKIVFDRVANVPGIYPVSKAQITITYFDNAKFSVSGIDIVCDDSDKYRYAAYGNQGYTYITILTDVQMYMFMEKPSKICVQCTCTPIFNDFNPCTSVFVRFSTMYKRKCDFQLGCSNTNTIFN